MIEGLRTRYLSFCAILGNGCFCRALQMVENVLTHTITPVKTQTSKACEKSPVYTNKPLPVFEMYSPFRAKFSMY